MVQMDIYVYAAAQENGQASRFHLQLYDYGFVLLVNGFVAEPI